MSIIKKSKKAPAEMGKPSTPSLSIALGSQKHAKKKMALGGAVESPMHSKGYQGTPATPAKKPDNSRRPQDAYMGEKWGGSPELSDASNTSMRPPMEQYMGDKWAEGGMIKDQAPAQMAAWHQQQADKYKMMASGGMVDDKPASIAEAILRKRKFADGGMVDLEANSEEHPNGYYPLNEEAAGEEQYDDSQISAQPWDSNEKGDSEEDESENKNDMISSIRSKMKAKAGR